MTLAEDRKQPLSARIYDDLRTQIVSLALEPGTMIFENSIAAAHGASRTPVRQALTLLEREELVEVLPQRGARVAPLSIRKFHEAQAVRETLELAAFRTAATVWNSDDPEFAARDRDIEYNLQLQKVSSETSDYLMFTRLDNEFHAAFMVAAGNLTLFNVVTSMRTHLNRMRYLELAVMKHERSSMQQHHDIRDAVRRNDIDGTQALLSEHLGLLDGARDDIIAKHSHLFTD